MTPLIDTTEMYLRTVWELEEEGLTPIRARLVERLNLSAPAVSETVTRLDDEGLMHIDRDRTLQLTEKGRERALSVMRKHRLAELLLTDVIGMDWERVHNEACRWEHVISDAAEARIATVLGDPATCPYGNPIPGPDGPVSHGDVRSLGEAARWDAVVTIERISEQLQSDVEALQFLRTHGFQPGARAVISRHAGQTTARTTDERGASTAGVGDEGVLIPPAIADLVYVSVD